MVVQDGDPHPRRTAYDIPTWMAQALPSDFPTVDDCLEGAFVARYAPEWIAASFEHAAGRGPDPGPPLPAS